MLLLLLVIVKSRCVTFIVSYSQATVCYCYCVLIIQYSHGVLLLLCVNYAAQSRCVTVIVC